MGGWQHKWKIDKNPLLSVKLHAQECAYMHGRASDGVVRRRRCGGGGTATVNKGRKKTQICSVSLVFWYT